MFESPSETQQTRGATNTGNTATPQGSLVVLVVANEAVPALVCGWEARVVWSSGDLQVPTRRADITLGLTTTSTESGVNTFCSPPASRLSWSCHSSVQIETACCLPALQAAAEGVT